MQRSRGLFRMAPDHSCRRTVRASLLGVLWWERFRYNPNRLTVCLRVGRLEHMDTTALPRTTVTLAFIETEGSPFLIAAQNDLDPDASRYDSYYGQTLLDFHADGAEVREFTIVVDLDAPVVNVDDAVNLSLLFDENGVLVAASGRAPYTSDWEFNKTADRVDNPRLVDLAVDGAAVAAAFGPVALASSHLA